MGNGRALIDGWRSTGAGLARRGVVLTTVALVLAGCTGATPELQPESSSAPNVTGEATSGAVPGPQGDEGPTAAGPDAYPPAPPVPSGPLPDDLAAAIDAATATFIVGNLSAEALEAVVAGDDARVGWWLSDLVRFAGADDVGMVADAFRDLTGVPVTGADPSATWLTLTNTMIAWDLPAWPGYREVKADIFTTLERGWEPFFTDADATIDWRLLSWGGVRMDARPPGDDEPCRRGCIPALDDPALVEAAEGEWYPDDATVFGIELAGESVALPRNIMQVHEMVNMDLAGRRLGIPYCTLCNSAQAWILDGVLPGLPDAGAAASDGDPSSTDEDDDGAELPGGRRPTAVPIDTDGLLVLRTSGLLTRSNKVMYDLATRSVIDTFTGEARSGPLLDADVHLEQVTVVTSSWGEWRQDHPDTRIIARDGGIGREYPDDPLRGRDDDGPIFPVGPVDPRLPVQADVVGAIAADGTPVAFPTEQAVSALLAGDVVATDGLVAMLDGDGLRVVDEGGTEVVAHQSFWFAWSQFWPTTVVWSPQG